MILRLLLLACICSIGWVDEAKDFFKRPYYANFEASIKSPFESSFPEFKAEKAESNYAKLTKAQLAFFEKFGGLWINEKSANYQNLNTRLYQLLVTRDSNGLHFGIRNRDSIMVNFRDSTFYMSQEGDVTDIEDIVTFKGIDGFVHVDGPPKTTGFFDGIIKQKKAEGKSFEQRYLHINEGDLRSFLYSLFYDLVQLQSRPFFDKYSSKSGIQFPQRENSYASIGFDKNESEIYGLQNVVTEFLTLRFKVLVNVDFSIDAGQISKLSDKFDLIEFVFDDHRTYFGLGLTKESGKIKITYLNLQFSPAP